MMGVWKGAFIVLCTAIAVLWLPNLFHTRRPIVLGGFVKPGWEKVEQVFRKNVESGVEMGGSFAVYHRGEAVVHLYGGYADEEAASPWRRDTLSPFFSATKGVGAILMALLVDRGLLEYDQPVSKYWPEFAKNGKKDITVRQLLSHQTGLVKLQETVSKFMLVDDPRRLAQMAADTPQVWRVGEGVGYHGMTIGIFMDELIRRTDPEHRNLTTFFDDEIRRPYDVDFFIGMPRSEHYRAVRYQDLKPAQMLSELIFATEMIRMMVPFILGRKTLFRDCLLFKEYFNNEFSINNPTIREIPIASNMGFGSVQGMAKIWGIMANGGKLDGKKLMSEKAVQALDDPVMSGIDKLLGVNITYGLGTHVETSSEGNFLAGHPGAGGQMGYMDYTRQLGWGYVTNYPGIKFRLNKYEALEKAMYQAVQSMK